MNILHNIFDENEIAIKQYYLSNTPKDTEVFLAFDLYRASSRNFRSLEILSTVLQEYVTLDNITHQEIFAQYMETHIGLDYQFFNYMKDTNFFHNFITNYGSNIQEKITTLKEKIENGTINNPSTSIHDLDKINEIISNIGLSKEQKSIPLPKPLTQYPLQWRLNDLKKPISQEHSTALEEDLLINLYPHFKSKNLPTEYLNDIIIQTKEIRDNLVKHSGNIPDIFSPLVYCIHSDIISVIAQKDNLDKKFTYDTLWSNTTKYNLNNISQAQLKTIDTPRELSKNYNHNKVKEALWVLTQDGEIVFGETKINNNGRAVHHIDLANGKDVISAGMILFSEDMKKVIAINPGSGHYKPSADSCIHMQKIIEKSFFDTKNLIMCDDYSWKPKVEIAPTIKPISINMDIINKNISLIKKNGLKESIDNTKVLPKFNK